jgi:hypothetical protein
VAQADEHVSTLIMLFNSGSVKGQDAPKKVAALA